MSNRHAVKVSPQVADLYRAEARRRGVPCTRLILDELAAAADEVLAGRGALLPAAPKPGKRPQGVPPEGDLRHQLKWTQDPDEYERVRAVLASAGSSPTAVLRNPRLLAGVTRSTSG